MNNRKIYVVGGSQYYAIWMQGDLVPRLKDADLVVFTGGEDVDPSMYREKRHPSTSSSLIRDYREAEQFRAAVDLNKKIVGICRGSQFVCVMSGGKLVQHQYNPGPHPLLVLQPENFEAKRQITVTSTHHQAQYPWGLKPDEFKIFGHSMDLSPYHEDGHRSELVIDNPVAKGIEVEDCLYRKTNALGIQSHPENDLNNEPMIRHYQRMLDLHMEDAL